MAVLDRQQRRVQHCLLLTGKRGEAVVQLTRIGDQIVVLLLAVGVLDVKGRPVPVWFVSTQTNATKQVDAPVAAVNKKSSVTLALVFKQ